MNETCIIVFAKAPVAGEVKTRLVPALGPERAARLHGELLRHTLDTACGCGHPVELWCDGDTRDIFFTGLRGQYPLTLHHQRGPDLGARMAAAFAETLTRTERVLLIGSDCPAITRHDMHAAFAALRRYDAVLGPATDGGYWAMGLRRVDASLFEGIGWGGDSVLRDTLRRLDELNWQWHLLNVYSDIDRPDDLAHLPASLRAFAS